MSLGLIIKCPEGLVLSAESRVTIGHLMGGTRIHNHFDNAKKLLTFNGVHKHIGVITFGLGALKFRTAHSFMPEFESSLPDHRISVKEFAQKLSDFFLEQWDKEKMPAIKDYKAEPMVFYVSGFDEGEPYGSAYEFTIPHKPSPIKIRKEGEFGVNWGGQREILDRLLQGYDSRALNIIRDSLKLPDPIMNKLINDLRKLGLHLPVQLMALQDCINLATFMMNTTIQGQELTVGVRGCGGNIDIAVITRTDGVRIINQKQLEVQ